LIDLIKKGNMNVSEHKTTLHLDNITFRQHYI